MDLAYLHIVLNHLPIMGVPIGLGLLLLGIVTSNDSIKRAALLAFVVLGLLSIPVYLTGKGGEDFVEDLAGVSEAAIEAHETMATFALISVSLLAAFALFAFLKYGGLTLFKRRIADESKLLNGEVAPGSASGIPFWVLLVTLALAAGTAGVLGFTGKLGGKIRHTEFYGGAQSTEGETDNGKGRRGKNETVDPAGANANTAKPPEEEEPNGPEKDESGKGRNRRGRRK
ncbi:MAG: hypothetical protein IPI76_16435 [Chloracidobacterium sp.]|nr:hypothetical protein [Chloracidobacterium sp.]